MPTVQRPSGMQFATWWSGKNLQGWKLLWKRILNGASMVIEAISDAGPIIHLSEISMIKGFSIFSIVYVPREVYNEVKAANLPGNAEVESDIFNIIDPGSNQKDRSEYFSRKFEISIADGSVIATAKNMGIDIVLTDDLDVRNVVRTYSIKPVDSIGILLRAYRENLITLDEVNKALDDLLQVSTLYVTSRLVERVRSKVKEYASKT
jgi:predicted nucleic acid-binding protein